MVGSTLNIYSTLLKVCPTVEAKALLILHFIDCLTSSDSGCYLDSINQIVIVRGLILELSYMRRKEECEG